MPKTTANRIGQAAAAAGPEPEDRRVLGTAVLAAAEALGLTSGRLARVLGVSAATVSRLRRGNYRLNPAGKEWELALLLVRLHRSLDAICAGDETVMRQWMSHRNHDLGDVIPRERIEAVAGLVTVLDYLDAQRAVV